MRHDIDQYIANCQVCRWAENPQDKTSGLLKPLSIPQQVWQHISIDFQEFPKDKHSYDNVLMVVNQLRKHSISISYYKEITAEETAHFFIKYIYQYKGPPDTIVSDHNPQFISQFWKEFCQILQIKLKLSTAHHLQTDRQTEVINQHIQKQLQLFVSYY
jgi:transposase InsO family protein